MSDDRHEPTYLVIHEVLPPTNHFEHDPRDIPAAVIDYLKSNRIELYSHVNRLDFSIVDDGSSSNSDEDDPRWSIYFNGPHVIKLYAFGSNEEYFLHVRMHVVCSHFTNNDAEIAILTNRLHNIHATSSVLANIVNDVHFKIHGCFDKYVAFWQAWSVPLPDDLRRHVFGFLSQ